jgi:hypothetical protein
MLKFGVIFAIGVYIITVCHAEQYVFWNRSKLYGIAVNYISKAF